MPDEQKAADIPLSRWQKVQQQLWFQGCVISCFPLVIGIFLLPAHPDRLWHVEGIVREATAKKGNWHIVLMHGNNERTNSGNLLIVDSRLLKDGRKLVGQFIGADVSYGGTYRLSTIDTVLFNYEDLYRLRWKVAKIYLIAACIGFALSAAFASAALRRFLLWVPRPSAKSK
jgi:hypothetical protein